MTDGQITEVGSYGELIENDGAFAQFLQTYQDTETNEDENGTTNWFYEHIIVDTFWSWLFSQFL